MMLLRLSRASFWFATAVAAWALVAPGGNETALVSVVVVASALAFGLWRSALRAGQRSDALHVLVPEATPLGEAALGDAAALLVRSIVETGSFEASLHAAARVLRAELGARDASVSVVSGFDATHARLSGLIEWQPGFRMAECRVRLDTAPLGRALREQRAASDSFGACAVPVRLGGQVVAVVELAAIGVAVEPAALAGLLGLACTALSARAEARAESGSARGLGAGSRAQTEPAQVLVVDDNVQQLEETAGTLGRLGCRVVAASGMLEGLHALCRTQFDMVLIDLRVSGMGGAEGLNWLRCNPGDVYNFMTRRDTPVIALTDPGFPADQECLRELGFDDQLFKPLRQDQMTAMLSKHLRVHAAADEHGGAALPPEAVPVLDPVALARLTELDPTGANHLVERVLQAFQTSAARLWPQAEAARLSGDRATLRLVAHTLKSSSAAIGAMHLSQLCAQVEGAIRLDAPDDLGGMLDAMGTALGAVLQAIAQLLEPRE